ncbi:MAG TPA: gliding motility-associated C-terminal domain-containing protein [Mucilaginibacter sp.]|jgi:gliding motility-associated-like protein|nr:gliding motility-associated C-terminal domain-containing protein [Mucilaginibacter sp.]
MRSICFKLLLTLFCISITLHVRGQTCNGSLGDPVIDEDFGSGANPGAPLPNGVTNMTYVNTSCPIDGSYTIANSSGNCFNDAWHFLTQDHTGNPNGYMMVVNASYQPSIFFNQQTLAGQLCPNTKYEFAAWILNLDVPSTCGGNPILPNITFTIQTTGGTVLQTYNTGDIPATNNILWKQYGTFFTTPANSSEAIVVVMTNNAPGGCGNDFALDDITFRACGPIILSGFGSATGSNNVSLCQGGSAIYNLQASVVGDNNPVYQWQSNTNGSGWADMAGSTSNAVSVPFNNATPGVYQYRLGIANGSAITSAQCRVYSKPLTVNVNPLPVVPAFADQTICQGGQFMLNATGGATYTWTGPGLAATSQNPLIINNASPANTGTYTVVAVSDSGCTAAPVQAKVTVVPKIVPDISGPAAVCAGEGTQLNATGGLYYRWTPSTGLDNDTIANPTATPLQTTTYAAHISNGGCVDSSKTVTVTVNQNPVADAGNEIILFEGQSAKLNGSITGDNITNYYWTPATFLSDPSLLTPTATPTDNITYTLTAVSQTCGTSTSSVFVRVYKKITIPNAFSPNNDGINDFWNIDALVTYPESITQVFDRYGQQVFQSTGYARPWDGTNNGKPLPAGTYYYIIDLKNGQPKLSGWVLIVR